MNDMFLLKLSYLFINYYHFILFIFYHAILLSINLSPPDTVIWNEILIWDNKAEKLPISVFAFLHRFYAFPGISGLKIVDV